MYILTSNSRLGTDKNKAISRTLAKLISIEFGYDKEWAMNGSTIPPIPKTLQNTRSPVGIFTQFFQNVHNITSQSVGVMLTLVPGNYKSLICLKNKGHIWWIYYLNDSL